METLRSLIWYRAACFPLNSRQNHCIDLLKQGAINNQDTQI
jgi:hypothetical protein